MSTSIRESNGLAPARIAGPAAAACCAVRLRTVVLGSISSTSSTHSGYNTELSCPLITYRPGWQTEEEFALLALQNEDTLVVSLNTHAADCAKWDELGFADALVTEGEARAAACSTGASLASAAHVIVAKRVLGHFHVSKSPGYQLQTPKRSKGSLLVDESWRRWLRRWWRLGAFPPPALEHHNGIAHYSCSLSSLLFGLALPLQLGFALQPCIF